MNRGKMLKRSKNVEKELIGCRCGTETASLCAVQNLATNTGEEESERQGAGLFKPVFDGDATRFVGISARRSMLSEREGGRKVLVTGGTRMCTRCGAGGLARGGVGGGGLT
jgi:hypothetical protein